MKKGFTLIELLAVIVVLGVVALIAAPVINGIMQSTRKNAFKNSAYGIVNSAKNYYSKQTSNYDFIGKTFKFNSDVEELNFEGKKPKNGTVTIKENGEIELYVTDGEFCAFKSFSDTEIIITDITENGCGNNIEIPEINIIGKKITTNTVSLEALCSLKNNSKVSIVKYEFSKDGGKTWNSKQGKNLEYLNYYTYTDLKQKENYEFKARCITDIGTKGEKKADIQLNNITKPIITASPSGWATEKKVIIQFPKGRYKYQISEDEGKTWIDVDATEGKDYNIYEKIYKDNLIIIAKVSDYSDNYVNSDSYKINMIDKTGPQAEVLTSNITTDSITVSAICTDDESGISKIEYSKDNGNTWFQNGTNTTYTFAELIQTKEYTFKVRCTNGSKLQTISAPVTEKTKTIFAPEIVIPGGWSTSKQLTITYNGTNIRTPKYFVKATVNGTTNVALKKCGTTQPKTSCTGESINAGDTISSGTWYELNSGTSLKITINQNGSIYAITSDGTNVKAATTATVTKIDRTPPTCGIFIGNSTWTKNNVTLKLSCNDTESGCTSSSYNVKTYSSGTVKTDNVSYTITDKAGNTTTCSGNVDVYLDKTPPTCGTFMGNNTWTKNNVTLRLSCSDTGSGCTSSSYNVKTYSSGTVKTDNVSYTITDNVGNTNTCNGSANIYLDKTPPTCGTFIGNSTWTKNNVTVKLLCSDTGSGCTSSSYNVKTYNSNAKKTDNVSYTITDNVGNTAACSGNVNIYLDKVKPNITLAEVANMTKDSYTIVLPPAVDKHSGIKSVKVGTKSLSVNSNGNYTYKVKNNSSVTFEATDKAGNIETSEFTLNATYWYIVQLYNGALCRSPENSGFQYWYTQISNGKSLDDIIKYFYINAPEATNNWNNKKCVYNNSKYVLGLYKGILGKDVSTTDSGYKYWLEQLTNGKTREDILKSILATDEYKSIKTKYGFDNIKTNTKGYPPYVKYIESNTCQAKNSSGKSVRGTIIDNYCYVCLNGGKLNTKTLRCNY